MSELCSVVDRISLVRERSRFGAFSTADGVAMRGFSMSGICGRSIRSVCVSVANHFPGFTILQREREVDVLDVDKIR